MKKYIYIFSIFLSAGSAFMLTSCDDEIQPIESLELGRVLSPLTLEAFVRDNTAIELKWIPSEETDRYLVEFAEDSLEFNTIIYSAEVSEDEIPYRHTFAGETRYSARVRALSENDKEDSKWATVTIETLPENIFEELSLPNVEVTTALLTWEPESEVSHFLIVPGNTQRPITADEKEAGEAVIEELTEGTDYTVTLYNGNKKRGVTEFTTLLPANVLAGDNLADKIAAAAEGDVLVLETGIYSAGVVPLTKSITIQGQKPFDVPTIYAKFTVATAVNAVAFKTLNLRGDDPVTPQAQFFESLAGGNLTSLTVEGCDVGFYTNQIVYNNSGATFGTISLKKSFFHDFAGSGGDGLDFRGGAITALQVEDCTFANGFRSFLRMQVACATSFSNCTFYHISIVDNSNNTGLFRTNVGGTLNVSNCLFAQTGLAAPTAVTAGNFCRNAASMVATATYDNNNIHSCNNLMVGLYTDPVQVDATTLDPQFVDPASNDFTITNQTLIDRKVGDPRWYE